MRTSKAYLLSLQRNQPPQLAFGRNSKAGKSCFIAEKREGFRYALTGDCWHGESRSGYFLTKVLKEFNGEMTNISPIDTGTTLYLFTKKKKKKSAII